MAETRPKHVHTVTLPTPIKADDKNKYMHLVTGVKFT